MSGPPDPAASARRVSLWMALLALPLIAGALLLPRLLRAGPAGAAGGEGAPAAPPRAEGPTAAQLEAAREAEEALAKARAGWAQTQTFAPRDPVTGPGGERTTPFEGFGLSVTTTPPGAVLAVNGREVGETPVLASVACRPGEPVALALSRRGAAPERRTVRCLADALLHLEVALPPAPPPRP